VGVFKANDLLLITFSFVETVISSIALVVTSMDWAFLRAPPVKVQIGIFDEIFDVERSAEELCQSAEVDVQV
jgi:hypothetical protein